MRSEVEDSEAGTARATVCQEVAFDVEGHYRTVTGRQMVMLT